MTKAVHSTTNAPRGKDPAVLSTLGKDVLDTAWRIALPVIICVIPGIMLDKAFGTAPWLTLALTAGGFFIAGWLVKKQLTALEKEDK